MPKSNYTSLGAMDKSSFFYTQFALLVEKLENRHMTPELIPDAPWDAAITAELNAMSLADLFLPIGIKDEPYAAAVKCGILLWNDELEPSHEIAQQIENETGSYWHGVMHRREGDFSNSKYWFDKVGQHPVYEKLFKASSRIGNEIPQRSPDLDAKRAALQAAGKWDAFGFVDWCEADEAGDLDETAGYFLKKLQLAEIRLLVEYCYQRAIGR